MNEKIKGIHDSPAYGNIIEMGCGVAISNILLSVEGATKTISEIKVPYSKESQEEHYKSTHRSVSKEFVLDVLNKESGSTWYPTFHKKPKENFIMVASFQMQGSGQSNLTHGYIGIYEKQSTVVRIYHVSIPGQMPRQVYFDIIGKIGVDILYDHMFMVNELNSQYIDQVWAIHAGENIFHADFYRTFNILKNTEYDNFIVINPDKQFIRFEDFARDKPGAILLKGSFNPIHTYHKVMMDDTIKLYPDYAAAFICSIKRFDKDDINIIDLEEKINKITGLGYHIIIHKNLLFTDCTNWIKQRWDIPVIFPAGMDTLNRWIDAEMESPTTEFTDNFKFIVFDRQGYEITKNAEAFVKSKKHNDYFEIIQPSIADDGMSSTKIRAGLLKSGL